MSQDDRQPLRVVRVTELYGEFQEKERLTYVLATQVMCWHTATGWQADLPHYTRLGLVDGSSLKVRETCQEIVVLLGAEVAILADARDDVTSPAGPRP